VSRIEIVEFLGESKQEVNSTLSELVGYSILHQETHVQNSDFDMFSIPSLIQKKSFNELF
jgi:hypothetical protein